MELTNSCIYYLLRKKNKKRKTKQANANILIAIQYLYILNSAFPCIPFSV